MPIETENSLRERSREAVEAGRESRESREGERDDELKRAAAMERADFLVKEVKQGRQQMQNIMVHMSSVLAALAKLREELSLADGGGDPSSVARDKERVERLKKQIAEYKDELLKMKDELVREQMEELRRGGAEDAGLRERAEAMVARVLREVDLE